MSTSFVKEFSISSRTKRSAEEIKKAKDLLEKTYDEDSKMVTGVFHNVETAGGDLEFTYRKYKKDPHRSYRFEDGKKYTIPLMVAKHINNDTQHARRIYGKNADGAPTMMTFVGSKRKRFEFLSTEFM
jgi:hypothetical protein